MKPVCRSDLLVQNVDDELVVLDRKNDAIHRLNGTAAFVWQQCDGTRADARIAEQVTEKFDVSYEVAHKDVLRIIGEFASLGLLVKQ